METHHALWIILGLIFVLTISCFIYVINKKFSLIPFTVLLTIAGIIANYFNVEFLNFIKLNPESVLLIFLPILLFESAFNFDFREFKRIIVPGFLLATIGLLISAVIIALPLTLFFNISFPAAFMFGAVISSTDPIAVLTLFKQMGVPKKLQLLIDGESFLNDATSVIMYRITLGFASGVVSTFGALEIAKSFLDFIYLFGGGIVLGAFIGYLFSEIIYRIKNISVVEITLTILLAHFAFILAEDFLKVSGIVTVLVTGLVAGNYGRTKISPQVTENMHETWNLLVFLTTSIVFFMIGYEIDLLSLKNHWDIILITIISMLIGRSLSVYGVLFPYNYFVQKANKIPVSWMHIANWGGLRGSLPLIILLSLDNNFIYKELFLNLVIGVIFFTLIVNATTIKPLIQSLGLDKINQTNTIEAIIIETLILKNLKKKLKVLFKLNEISKAIFEQKIKTIKNKLIENKSKIEKISENNLNEFYLEVDKILRRYCLQVEKNVYKNLFKKGVIPEVVYSTLKNDIDRQIERINEGLEQLAFDKETNTTGSKTLKINWFDRLILFFDEELDLEKKLISLNYKYHKSRLLGDEKVLSELKNFKKIDFLPQNVVNGVIKFYEELLDYNLSTLKEIENSSPETTRTAENAFANIEIKYYTDVILHEFGEQERVSSKCIQCVAREYSIA